MTLSRGTFLKSTEALNEDYFAGATIYLVEYNQNGATGFVVNKPFGRSFNELEEFKQSINFPLYEGGPVDKEHLFVLHQRPDIIEGSSPVCNRTYFGGNFKHAVTAINNKTLSEKDIKLFVGYCGWDKGELENEIAEGYWLIVDDVEESIF